jgi:hypothetical protein
MKKLLTSFETIEFLVKQGHKVSKEQWLELNVEGSIEFPLTQEEVSYINNYTQVTATMKGLSVC